MPNDAPMPRVAVILVAYGGRDDTLACIESVGESDYPNFKIVLVDNNSPDDTVSQVTEKYPKTEIIRSDKNLGFAGGNNLGIKSAIKDGFDYLFLLNNDTEIDPGTISSLIESAERKDNLGAIGPKIYYHQDKTMIWSAGGFIDFNWSTLYHRGIREQDTGQYDEPTEIDYQTGCALMFPAGIVGEIGTLDESYWMYYEDADFCERIKKSGRKIYYEPSGKVWHKISSSTGGNLSTKKVWYKFRSGFNFFLRHSESPFWFITYPLSQLYAYVKALGHL